MGTTEIDLQSFRIRHFVCRHLAERNFVYYDFRLYLQSAPGILASFNENLNSPIGVAYARLLKSHSVDYD